MLKTGLTRWSLAAIAAVGLFAGVAWALETQAVSIPAGSSFQLTAVLVPGDQGADVCAGPSDFEDNDVRLSIKFTPWGVVANGVCYGPFDPCASHTVVAKGYKVGGQWFCDISVVDDCTGMEIAHQCGHGMTGRPEEARATGQSVTSLTAE